MTPQVRKRLLARFTVPGDPVAKQRARTFTRAGRTITYTPEKTRAYEQTVSVYYRRSRYKKHTGDLSVTAYFWQATRHRKDIDNLLKSVLDGLNGVAWEDDHQIRHIEAYKAYDKDRPRAVIEIYEMENKK